MEVFGLLPDWASVVIVTLLIPLLVQAYKILTKKVGIETGTRVMNIVVLLISAGVCIIVKPPVFPELIGDPSLYLQEMVAALLMYFSAVKIVYDFVLKKFFELLEPKQ